MLNNISTLEWGFDRFFHSAWRKGYLYNPPVTDGITGSCITRGGQQLINFAGINFLGLQEIPEVIDNFCHSARELGLVTGGSRATQGISRAHLCLEQLVSAVQGRPATLTFGTGLLANIGFVQAMTAKFQFDRDCQIDNRDTVFVMDRDSHWSLWKATSHLKFGKQLFSFRHNDPRDLEAVLAELVARKVVVVFESVYSSDGSIAPIGAILDVCEKYGALSYCDDANGFLIYGESNPRFADEFRHMSRATFVMVSFSKAVGLEGGAISGPQEYIGSFEILSGTSLFTAAIQPPTAATICQVINYLCNHPQVMENYLARCDRFRQRLMDLGFLLNPDPSYITSVLLGDDARAEAIRQELLNEGICVPVFRYPAVRPNRAVMRLILNDRHSEEDIERFLASFMRIRDRHGLRAA